MKESNGGRLTGQVILVVLEFAKCLVPGNSLDDTDCERDTTEQEHERDCDLLLECHVQGPYAWDWDNENEYCLWSVTFIWYKESKALTISQNVDVCLSLVDGVLEDALLGGSTVLVPVCVDGVAFEESSKEEGDHPDADNADERPGRDGEPAGVVRAAEDATVQEDD